MNTLLFSDMPGDEGLPGPQRCWAMIAVMTATTMAVFDGSIVNIALPQIANALAVPTSNAIWVSNGYLLAVAMTLATFAALAKRVGFRGLFASGLAVFTLASLGCALSTSLPCLTAMRVLQGIGGAATLAIAPAIHRSIFPNRLLGRILGLHALLIAISTAISPILGGTLLTALSWQWIFAINLPLGIIGIALTLRAVPNTHASTHPPFDIAGAVLSAVAMAALIMAANACAGLGASAHTTLSVWTPIAYACVAVLASAMFIWRQRCALAPLLPLDMFASTRFSMAALTSLASFVAQGMTFIALPILFESAYGYNAFASALLFTPWPIGIILAAPHAGRLADRYPPVALATTGLGVFVVGLVLLALLPSHPSPLNIAWRELMCGAGFGIFQSPNNREMMANASRERSASASGVLAIVRTFGQCLGVAVVGVILSASASTSMPSSSANSSLAHSAYIAHAVSASLWLAAGASALALFISAVRSGRMGTVSP